MTNLEGLTGGGSSDGGGGSDGALDAATGDAGADAPPDGTNDGPPMAPCDLARPFGLARNVPNINGAGDETGARISADGLTLLYSEGSGIDRYLLIVTRANVGVDFGATSMGLNPGGVGTAASGSMTGDGLKLYFQGPNPGSGIDDVWMGSRLNTTTDFGGDAPVANVNFGNPTIPDGEPIISADGKTLFFDSTRGGQYDIWTTTMGPSGDFAAPSLVGVSVPPSNTGYPVLSSDGLTLFFGSDRPLMSAGAEDIWVTHRTTTTDVFGPVTNVAELNTASQDWPTSLSTDGCTLYFASSRGGTGAQGMSDIWMATRPK